ncbi:MAG: hypothetical protein ACI4QA_05615 [Candidatus Spyradosoma sp.]
MKNDEHYDEEEELKKLDPRELEELKSGKYDFVDKLMKAAFSEIADVPPLEEIIRRAKERERVAAENLFEFDFEELTEDSLDALSAAGEKSPDSDDDPASGNRRRKK